ncbi:MAG: aminotransferase class V-fold PLP-dependent enzyme, partial [Acidimicrobiia bacterium]
LEDRYRLSQYIPPDERPVVFIGPYEHHSNELPWRESIADVVTIPEDADGHIDLARLEDELTHYANREVKIGSFSAASNVTGIISDVQPISILLHRHGALSFWDFAAAAPYVDIDMNPPANGPDAGLAYKDAIYLSPHKFIGGPGTPGVLVARKELFTNRVPAVPGGGTVAYVNPVEHRYLSDIEHREEGGTPAIIESIRAGMVFQLKRAVGVAAIKAREEDMTGRAIASWSANRHIEILGNPRADRLSIVSFVVRYGDRYLHHNFVVALLNDLFGIQSRGGCSCAGPYGHRLLGIDLDKSREFEREIARGCEGIKPGWVRVNFNYFISDQVRAFILDAVHFVAVEGWRFLPYYRFDPQSALWRHRQPLAEPPLSLDDIDYSSGEMAYRRRPKFHSDDALAGYIEEARKIVAGLEDAEAPEPLGAPVVTADFEHLRWFPFPDELRGVVRVTE